MMKIFIEKQIYCYKMKQSLLSLLLSGILFAFHAITVSAQDVDATETAPEKQHFTFLYVAKDNSMPLQTLLANVNDRFNHAIAEGPAIFYLSTGKAPTIMTFNFSDESREPSQIREDFEQNILAPLQEQLSYSVDGAFDKHQILKLLQDNNFIWNDGRLMYGQTDFEFYVGQNFWTSGNNEALIASLFFELDIASFIVNENFSFNVYCPRNINYTDDKAPFGTMNPDGINAAITPRKVL